MAKTAFESILLSFQRFPFWLRLLYCLEPWKIENFWHF
ncbi:hypothetical protein LSS_23215 [Leptospira santarosai serovar Shermani str. LT 821]|uniref:Uncharacterized protein n=1 Tax=Leptospira santarosai serovar Shermani str. LT 821 TaxID=758847 RepID=A0A097ET27_9LEPT|nr:hypothetical protein LSS_23215 [Leptospira santarosai serovar Shermani str. LT 821]